MRDDQGKVTGSAAEGVFPDARTGHLIRAIVFPESAEGHWRDYVAATGVERPNEGETRLFPLVAGNLGSALAGVPLADQLVKSLRWARIRQSLLMRARTQVAELLAGAGIPALWTKGTALGEVAYRPGELRTSADIDVIVRWANIAGIAARADAAGWVPKLVPTTFDAVGEIAGTELSYAILDLVDVDFSWQPRMPFAFDPRLRDWLWCARDADRLIQAADPTWLLLETFEHGMSANQVSPIRWVVDAVMLIGRCGERIDWSLLVDLAVQYRLTVMLREGLATVAAFGAEVPAVVGARLDAAAVDEDEVAEFAARVGIADISRNYQVFHAHNLMLRADDRQFATLQGRISGAAALGLPLRARVEGRKVRLAAGEESWAPGAPLVDATVPVEELMTQAGVLARQGHVALAHAHWQAACEAAPGDRIAALGLAQAAAVLEDPVATQTALAGVVARFPDYADVRLALARHLLRRKDHIGALRECDAVLADAPGHGGALGLRAQCLHHERRHEEALRDLEAAMEAQPDATGPRLQLATLLFELGRFDRVLELCREARAGAERWMPLNILGVRAMYRSGMRAKADKRIARLREFFPDDARIALVEIDELVASLDFAAGLARAEVFLRERPDTLAVYRMAMTCILALERFEALPRLLDAVPVGMRQGTSFQLSVLLPAYFQMRRGAECRKILATQNRDGLPADQGLQLVHALATHGEVEESYARLTDLLERFPDDLRVLQQCVVVFGGRSAEGLARIKAQFLARLSPLDRCRLLAGVPQHFMTGPERMMVTGWMLHEGGMKTASDRRRFLMTFQYETDRDRIRALRDGYRGTEPFVAVMAPVLEAHLAERVVVEAERVTVGARLRDLWRGVRGRA